MMKYAGMLITDKQEKIVRERPTFSSILKDMETLRTEYMKTGITDISIYETEYNNVGVQVGTRLCASLRVI